MNIKIGTEIYLPHQELTIKITDIRYQVDFVNGSEVFFKYDGYYPGDVAETSLTDVREWLWKGDWRIKD